MTHDEAKEDRSRPLDLGAEERLAAWSDFGQMVAPRIHSPDLIEVLNRASMKSKSTREMAGYIRAFILTGAKP